MGLGGAQMGKAECYKELVSSDLNNLKLTTVFPLPFGTGVKEGRQMPKMMSAKYPRFNQVTESPGAHSISNTYWHEQTTH